MKTAVAMIIFNRPDTTKEVFEAIRQAKPPRLYIISDAPREDREEEKRRLQKQEGMWKGTWTGTAK